MATLQVRDLDDRLYDLLKTTAKLQKRSISQEVVVILENYLSSWQQSPQNATLEFLSLGGAWHDDKSAAEIITSIKKRKNKLKVASSNRFGKQLHGIFD